MNVDERSSFALASLKEKTLPLANTNSVSQDLPLVRVASPLLPKEEANAKGEEKASLLRLLRGEVLILHLRLWNSYDTLLEVTSKYVQDYYHLQVDTQEL